MAKKKRRNLEEKDEEASVSSGGDEGSEDESEIAEQEENGHLNKKARPSEEQDDESGALVSSDALPVVTSEPLSVGPNKSLRENQPVIVLLDQATLETVKRNNMYELLNCDDHRELVKRKLRKDPNSYRPDILHQELLALQDSPLNKAGLLKIYVATQKKVLIDIHPSTRIPRTYKRFAGLMVQLLHKMKIKAGQDHTTLLKVIKNPFSQYLPAGTRCYGMSCQGTLYSPINLASALLPEDYENKRTPPTCFVVGAMSTGHVQLEDHPYMEKMISVSEYPLSGAAALSRIVTGIEHYWGIV